jgi:hypothetical protein
MAKLQLRGTFCLLAAPKAQGFGKWESCPMQMRASPLPADDLLPAPPLGLLEEGRAGAAQQAVEAAAVQAATQSSCSCCGFSCLPAEGLFTASVAIASVASIGLVLNAFNENDSYAQMGWIVGPILVVAATTGAAASRTDCLRRNNHLVYLLLLVECVMAVSGFFIWFVFLFSGLSGHKIG